MLNPTARALVQSYHLDPRPLYSPGSSSSESRGCISPNYTSNCCKVDCLLGCG